MVDIRVPRLNPNEDTYILVEWLVGDGQPIEPDEAVATLETAKAAEDLICPAGGVLWQLAPAGTECTPGTVIGRVVPLGTVRNTAARPPEPLPARSEGPVVTHPAQALIDALGVDPERVRRLGRMVVRRADIEALVANADEPRPIQRLPTHQRVVARTVEASHRTIPAAYTVMAVDVGVALRVANEASRRLRRPVGLPELLIAAVGRLVPRFPHCFGAPAGDGTLRLAADAHVGVTIDLGKGLSVPVITHASRRSLGEITEALAGFRRTAQQGRFRAAELSGGNITVALHHEPDVVLAIPLVFPGQTCCLALAGTRPEVVIDSDGSVATRTVAHLGLAYDHRFVNGREAWQFLQAVKELLGTEVTA